MSVTLQLLCEGSPDELPRGAFADLHAALRTESRLAHKRAGQDPELIAGVLETLDVARPRVTGWPLEEDVELRAALSGLQRTYRRGRRAEHRARHEPSAERLHELRKRSEDLRYAAGLLRPLAPKRFKALDRAAHELSDLLGEDHDLAVLLEHAEGLPGTLRRGELKLPTCLVEHRRDALQHRELKRARKIYRRKPARFTGRLSNAINPRT